MNILTSDAATAGPHAGPPVMEEARYEAVMPLPGEYDAVDARRANIGAFKRATKSAFASGRL